MQLAASFSKEDLGETTDVSPILKIDLFRIERSPFSIIVQDVELSKIRMTLPFIFCHLESFLHLKSSAYAKP